MWWIRFIWLLFKSVNFVTTHVNLVLSFLTGCVFVSLWKAYDVFWLLLQFLLAICIPPLREGTIPFEWYNFFKSKCARDEAGKRATSFRDAIAYVKVRTNSKDEEGTKKAKLLAYAVNTGLEVMRLRIAIGMIIGLEHAKHYTSVSGQLDTLTKLNFLDSACLFLTFIMFVVKQFRLMCKIGCGLYYLFAIIVVVVGAVTMELPMQFVQLRLDETWCRFNATADGEPTLCKVFACLGTKIN